MRRTARVLGSASAIVLILTLAGCGSQEPAAKASSPPPSTPTASSTDWVALHDEDAGVRFSLPHEVDPRSRAGQSPGLSSRVYQDQVGEIGLTVTVVTAGVDVPATYPRTIYDQMVSGLNSHGATNAGLSAVGTPDVAKGDALDATLTFTAKDGASNYWRMRTITAGHTVVSVQVLTFSDPGDTDAPKQVDAMFDQLARSVSLD